MEQITYDKRYFVYYLSEDGLLKELKEFKDRYYFSSSGYSSEEDALDAIKRNNIYQDVVIIIKYIRNFFPKEE